MKFVLAAVFLFVGFQAFAYPQQPQDPDQQYPEQPQPPQDPDQPDYPDQPQQPSDLIGSWILVRHTCSSGAPPADDFVPGRDRLTTTFDDDGRFTIRNRRAGCTMFTSGTYEERESLLTIWIERNYSNCGPVPPAPPSYTYSYEMNSPNRFSIMIGPVNGGVCPAGDILKNTFRRFDRGLAR